MEQKHFFHLGKEEYEQIARALVVYDHVRHRNAIGRKRHVEEISELQDRWLADADRFGDGKDEDRERIADEAYDEMDAFVEGETWQELAWWIADREWKRRAGGVEDKETRDLLTDRIYHEVMEEFARHGIDRLVLPSIPADADSPSRIVETLRRLRAETKRLGRRGQ